MVGHVDCAARAVPGVIEIMTWKNSAGQFKAMKSFSGGGSGSTSIEPLQTPEIRHDGEIVAVVLAESFEAARDASHRLKIDYIERKPTTTSAVRSIADSPSR